MKLHINNLKEQIQKNKLKVIAVAAAFMLFIGAGIYVSQIKINTALADEKPAAVKSEVKKDNKAKEAVGKKVEDKEKKEDKKKEEAKKEQESDDKKVASNKVETKKSSVSSAGSSASSAQTNNSASSKSSGHWETYTEQVLVSEGYYKPVTATREVTKTKYYCGGRYFNTYDEGYDFYINAEKNPGSLSPVNVTETEEYTYDEYVEPVYKTVTKKRWVEG